LAATSAITRQDLIEIKSSLRLVGVFGWDISLEYELCS